MTLKSPLDALPELCRCTWAYVHGLAGLSTLGFHLRVSASTSCPPSVGSLTWRKKNPIVYALRLSESPRALVSSSSLVCPPSRTNVFQILDVEFDLGTQLQGLAEKYDQRRRFGTLIHLLTTVLYSSSRPHIEIFKDSKCSNVQGGFVDGPICVRLCADSGCFNSPISNGVLRNLLARMLIREKAYKYDAVRNCFSKELAKSAQPESFV